LTNEPERGDFLLRGDGTSGWELVDAVTHAAIEGQLPTIQAAIEAARFHGGGTIWQQVVDNRGRPLGNPSRLMLAPSCGT
jgi:hypothetical protein